MKPIILNESVAYSDNDKEVIKYAEAYLLTRVLIGGIYDIESRHLIIPIVMNVGESRVFFNVDSNLVTKIEYTLNNTDDFVILF